MHPVNSQYLELPEALRSQVATELGQGEAVVFLTVPRPWQFSWSSEAAGLTLFGVLWTVVCVFIVRDTLQGGADFIEILLAAAFVLAGLGMLSSPLWALREAQNTAYVITNRRAMIVDGGGLRLRPGDEGISVGRAEPAVRSYDLDRLTHVRSEVKDGTIGDLIFETQFSRFGKSAGQSVGDRFRAISDVVAVEALLRQLVESATGGET